MLDARDLTVELDVEAGADGAVVRALDALSLSIERGETFALVGESGCGKSMTALALMRLLPDNGLVTGGDVHLRARAGEGGDVDVLALPEAAMRRVRGGRIGMIFQEPGTSLNPVMTVGRQVVEAIEAHTPLRGAAARARALEWLGRVGIPEPERRFDDYPFRMSGGQKQRVMIALALAAEPDFLVADEPTTALDVTIQAQILALLRQLQAERGMGLLLITHDLAVVSGMAHRVALMYAGQIVEVAPAAEFFAAPRHPYAQALMRALPSTESRGQPLMAIAGTVPPLTQRFEGCRFAPRCGVALPDCGQRAPRLEPVQAGHAVRCWRASESPAPRAASPAQAPAVAAEAPAGLGAEPPLLLQVQDLSVRFALQRAWLARGPREFSAVAGVSFELRAGRTLALVGESGCGKTTTGKALVQLLRGAARTEGRAWLHPAGGGQPQDLFALQGEALRAARREVQIVFQDPFASLDPRMGVREILDEGLTALRPELDESERRQRLERLVEQVGLRRDALDRYPHEFSGGQRQRIAIARALAVEPRLIVCDEPTSALDVSVQAQILNLLRELQRELGMSYLFITHNIGVVEVMADEVVVMRGGRVVEQGASQDVLTGARKGYARELLAAVPRIPRAS
ncbi:MAG: dipeptide ABC transporter ATP-binding protein [Rubrivivax sp.]|jgi:peptide/nickel transport system ATP-binding protein|nr:dipeptide ABC transporter ATP-binding protein [Rubrivivax sp.]